MKVEGEVQKDKSSDLSVSCSLIALERESGAASMNLFSMISLEQASWIPPCLTMSCTEVIRTLGPR